MMQTNNLPVVSANIPKGYAINWRTFECFKFNSCREANAFAAECDDRGKTEVGTYAFARNIVGDYSVKMPDFINLHNRLAVKFKLPKVTIFESRETAAAQLMWMLNKLPIKK